MTVAASAKERSCINMHQPHLQGSSTPTGTSPLLLVPKPKKRSDIQVLAAVSQMIVPSMQKQ